MLRNDQHQKVVARRGQDARALFARPLGIGPAALGALTAAFFPTSSVTYPFVAAWLAWSVMATRRIVARAV